MELNQHHYTNKSSLMKNFDAKNTDIDLPAIIQRASDKHQFEITEEDVVYEMNKLEQKKAFLMFFQRSDVSELVEDLEDELFMFFTVLFKDESFSSLSTRLIDLKQSIIDSASAQYLMKEGLHKEYSKEMNAANEPYIEEQLENYIDVNQGELL